MKHPAVRAVLFDFDGTLTLAGAIDFAAIRAAIGCPAGASILAFLDAIEDAERRDRTAAVIDRFELEAAARAAAQPGAVELLERLRAQGLALGIITRNSRASIDRSCAVIGAIRPEHFDVIVTRDDGFPAKPDPAGVHHACRVLGVSPAECVVVGDFVYDIEAGERAGAATVFFDSDPSRRFERPNADYTIDSLSELLPILEWLRPLPAGKLPNELLAPLLAQLPAADEALVVRPGVGEDCAVVRIDRVPSAAGDGVSGDRAPGRGTAGEGAAGDRASSDGAIGGEASCEAPLVVLTSDPITFVGDRIGRYAVTVNANDIAVSGGEPRWMLATALLPVSITPRAVRELFTELAEACASAHVTLCGGHTEVTSAVTRPVVSATMIGVARAGELRRKSAVRDGDLVFCTKYAALEGSVILATEHAKLAAERGVSAADLAACAALGAQLSIVPEARIAARFAEVRALHDVTEGGVATALEELSIAAGRRLVVELDAIPLLPATRRLCERFGIDPLGLIGSGALLVACGAAEAARLEAAIAGDGIPIVQVGVFEALEEGGVRWRRGGRDVEGPQFAADELARVPRAE